MSPHALFPMLAAYNAWANERVYASASELDEVDYRGDYGAFFRSVHGTLNHLLVGDRIWMHRFTGEGEPPAKLDAILYDSLDGLHSARREEDRRIQAYMGSLTADDLAKPIRYRTISSPADIEQPLGPALMHMFNHQTHHRGQVHCLLTKITGDAPSLDLIAFQRQTGLGLA